MDFSELLNGSQTYTLPLCLCVNVSEPHTQKDACLCINMHMLLALMWSSFVVKCYKGALIKETHSVMVKLKKSCADLVLGAFLFAPKDPTILKLHFGHGLSKLFH